jgi:TPR repeat protein
MKRGFTAALLAITLTLGSSGVAVAQAPEPAQAKAVDPIDAANDAAKAAYENSDYATAFSLMRPLADKGVASAQYMLGEMYHTNREGGWKNQAMDLDYQKEAKLEAARLYGLAAAQGYAPAQFRTGFLALRRGDPVSAARWFRLAASQGNAQAQAALANLYFKGKGVEKNEKEALRLLELASASDAEVEGISRGAMYGYGGTFKEQYELMKNSVDEEKIAAAQKNAAVQKIKDQEANIKKLVISDKAKNYRVNGDSFIVSGSSSSLKIVSKLDASVIKSIIINRGNCKTKKDYRDVPIRFGTVLNVGLVECEVVEVKIQTYHGDAVYEMNR